MGTPNLVPSPNAHDPNSIIRAIMKLSSLALGPTSTPTFAGLTLSGLTASRLMYSDANKKLASVASLSAWISGTSNQVIVADDGDGSITLSTPQDIHTGASPTFADLTLSAPVNIYALSHNSFADFVANEHIDWTGATQDFLTSGFGTINGLIPGADGLYDLGKEELVGGGGEELKISQPTYGGLSEFITSTSWRGNSFTPGEDMSVSKIVLRMFRSGSPTTATLYLTETTAGVPSGVPLASKTVDVSAITSDSAGELVEFTFDAAVDLTSGTMYAWYGTAASGQVKLVGSSSNQYAGGTHIWSNNSGSSWGTTAGWEHVFYIYAETSTTEYTRWQDLYLSGSLKDGTNSLTIANLQSAYDHIHNLTTDIDHDALTNFSADEHFVQTAITNVSSALSTGLLKVTTGTGALSVVTDNSGNWNTAYGWGNHASAGYAVSGGAEHDGFSDYVANEHIDWTNATQNFLTTGNATIGGNIKTPTTSSSTAGVIEHNSLRYMHSYGSVTNFFAGSEAGNFTLTGINNVGVGRRALQSLTSGQGNMSVGGLLSCTSGSFNMAVGSGALDTLTTTDNNVAVGTSALSQCTGANNTGIGISSGSTVTGNNNVFIGYASGNGSGGISGCVHLGTQAGRFNTTSNRLYLANSNTSSPLIYGEFDNTLVRINGTLDVNQKAYITAIGGYAIKLTNRTGGNTVAGQLVKADTANNDAVVLTAASDKECFGVFLDGGVANGSEAWVVVAGIADVAMADNTAATRGNWVETSTEAGYADATNADPVAAPIHFLEIGHCIETVTAGGAGTHILARCVLHFN